MWVKGKRMNKTWLGLSFVFGLALMLATPVLAGFQEGVDAYERGDYETALKKFLPLAEQGHAGAQNHLGELYAEGKGVPQDYTEAMKWYRLAADQGDAWAQSNLGWMYRKGQGVPQDYAEAVKWYRLAADEWDKEAQFNLGSMYEKGKGVPQDYAEAAKWYRLAADQGLEKAAKGLEVLEKEMTPAQIAEAQRLAREWKPKGE